jgi:hypothetical protein
MRVNQGDRRDVFTQQLLAIAPFYQREKFPEPKE